MFQREEQAKDKSGIDSGEKKVLGTIHFITQPVSPSLLHKGCLNVVT